MERLSQDYLSSICEIKTLSNDFLAAGMVIEITDDYLQIGSYRDERLPLIPFDSPVKIALHNLRAGFRVVAGTAYLSTEEMLRVVDVENLQDFERRGFFRVPAKLQGQITLKDPISGKFEQSMQIAIENVSLSGVFFSIPQGKPLSIGDVFLLELKIPTGMLALTCSVRRTDYGGVRPIRYGCEFFEYSPRDADKLCGYIFELQREMIRKKKSL